ncbi:glucosaminidase domain-containing protein [Oceanithermus sp.]
MTNLKRLRDEARMTQQELAVAAGLSVTYISYIESGRSRSPSANTVRAIARALAVPVVPKAVAAQAALESDWGRSQLAREANNLFGVKAGSSWTGPVIEFPTWEVVNGHRVETTARFRRYADYEAAVRDYVTIIGRLDWYADAREAARFGDPYGFVYGLEARGDEPGWATDLAYASKVLALMREYRLLEGPHPVWVNRLYLDGRRTVFDAASVTRTGIGLKLYIRRCNWLRRIFGGCNAQSS